MSYYNNTLEKLAPTGLLLAAATYQSKWGYHACDALTFQKLKLLNKVYRKAVRMYYRWFRWMRKEEKHRIGKEPQRMAFFDKPISWGELRSFASHKWGQESHIALKPYRMMQQVYSSDQTPVWLWTHHIPRAYKMARTPMASASNVEALPLTEEQIDQMLLTLSSEIAAMGEQIPTPKTVSAVAS